MIADQPIKNEPDVLLIGAGIMSATLAMLLKQVEPSWTIEIVERLDAAATESSDAIPYLFNYLNDGQIPGSTNQIEGYFAHLKEKLTLHRGLRFEAKKNFIKWYLHFKNQEKRSRFL